MSLPTRHLLATGAETSFWFLTIPASGTCLVLGDIKGASEAWRPRTASHHIGFRLPVATHAQDYRGILHGRYTSHADSHHRVSRYDPAAVMSLRRSGIEAVSPGCKQ